MPSNALVSTSVNTRPILSDSAYQQATSQIFWGVLGVLLLAGVVGMILARMPLAVVDGGDFDLVFLAG